MENNDIVVGCHNYWDWNQHHLFAGNRMYESLISSMSPFDDVKQALPCKILKITKSHMDSVFYRIHFSAVQLLNL